jgi:hypothetical protein
VATRATKEKIRVDDSNSNTRLPQSTRVFFSTSAIHPHLVGLREIDVLTYFWHGNVEVGIIWMAIVMSCGFGWFDKILSWEIKQDRFEVANDMVSLVYTWILESPERFSQIKYERYAPLSV